MINQKGGSEAPSLRERLPVDEAIGMSVCSPCQSKRGAVVFRDVPAGISIIGRGYNHKTGFTCDGSDACKSFCRRDALHAEQVALLVAGVRAQGCDVLHVKTVAGKLVPSGGPSCLECSKLMLAAGISGVWLYHDSGWRRYPIDEFHALTLQHVRDAAAALDGPRPSMPLEVIVNGQPVAVAPGPIRDVIASAIEKSGQIGAPLDQWVLRTREGDVIPHALPGGVEWALSGGQRLFLHLGLPPAAALDGSPAEIAQLREERDAMQRRAEAAESDWQLAEADLTRLRQQVQQLTEENDRLFDLVRYQRGELHEAGLITNEEYSRLLIDGGKSGRGSVARLETYDALRKRIKQADGTIVKLEHAATALGAQWKEAHARAEIAEQEVQRLRQQQQALQEGWQPIETAPKDGTRVLVHIGAAFRPLIAHWDPDCEDWADEDDFAPDPQPTHWMPLPDPPAASRPSGESERA